MSDYGFLKHENQCYTSIVATLASNKNILLVKIS